MFLRRTLAAGHAAQCHFHFNVVFEACSQDSRTSLQHTGHVFCKTVLASANTHLLVCLVSCVATKVCAVKTTQMLCDYIVL